MHLLGITAKQLAKAAGLNPKYMSTIMNGHVESKGADRLIAWLRENGIPADKIAECIEHITK